MQAVNKLAEIMNRKDINSGRGKNKVSSADLRKREKECRKLQQELTQEREKYGQMAAKWQKELQELQSQAQEDNLTRVRLQMELDSKDSEIEQLQVKLASLNSETASLSSGGAENEDDLMGQGMYILLQGVYRYWKYLNYWNYTCFLFTYWMYWNL